MTLSDYRSNEEMLYVVKRAAGARIRARRRSRRTVSTLAGGLLVAALIAAGVAMVHRSGNQLDVTLGPGRIGPPTTLTRPPP